jgi:hypothetical protein
MNPTESGDVALRGTCYRFLLTLLLALMLPAAVMAQSLDQAAHQAARQYDAKVLSARTVQEGDRQVHVIKLLTRDGVVKTVRVTVRDKNSH